MVKLIFKIIWTIIAVLCVILTIFFLFESDGSGIESLRSVFSDGFFNGIKTFFVDIWNGFKSTVGL